MAGVEDAVVVVTGGGAGVGRTLAREARRREARVVIASDSDTRESADMVAAEGGSASWAAADVSDDKAMVELATHVHENFGNTKFLTDGVDIGAEPDAGLDTALAARLFEVNMCGIRTDTRAFAANSRAATSRGEPAHILNDGREHSLGVPPQVMPIGPYLVGKYATLGFTAVAHRDFAGAGISVTMMAPGSVRIVLVQSMIVTHDHIRAKVVPYAQTCEFIDSHAIDSMLCGLYIAAHNPASRAFAMEHSRGAAAKVLRLPLTSETECAHDGTGDVSLCPIDRSLFENTPTK
ncbi:SDR family NAD(P)-dependent oxidoreductase [Nocardia aurea]|uniref:SDR family NAD(P)-dependent oxidoreductase n=1 Tax=Nocardia aurea TaxID=2144174 RepID=UPI001300A2C7|nr:SDR family NAD(P)-dependent oxidoreductase [Nocardia aurea]